MADDEADFDEELQTATRRAQTLLDKLQFAEAESGFRHVLRLCDRQRAASTSGEPAADFPPVDAPRCSPAVERAAVASISGLAEVYARQSRSFGNADIDDEAALSNWLRLMVRSLALHREAGELCRRALRRPDQRDDNEDIRFFKDVSTLSATRGRQVEDALVAAVRRQMIQNNGSNRTGFNQHDKVDRNRSSSDGNEWLKNVLSRCSESSTGTDYEEIQSTDTTESLSSSSSSLAGGAPDWNGNVTADVTNPVGVSGVGEPPVSPSGMPSRVRRRRINFDRIQNAIKQLVSDASSEVRAKYGHLFTTGNVPQSLLQRRVTSELMVRLAGVGRHGTELRDLISDSIIYDDDDDVDASGRYNDQDDRSAGSPVNPSEMLVDDVDDLDSNPDDPVNYETICMEFSPSVNIETLGHVIVRTPEPTIEPLPVDSAEYAAPFCSTPKRPGSARPERDAWPAAAPVDDDDRRQCNRVTILGLNRFGGERFEGVVTVWKSYGSVDEEDEEGEDVQDGAAEQPGEQKQTSSQQQQQPVSSTRSNGCGRPMLKRLPSFEEVSPLTERERVFRWLRSRSADDASQPNCPSEPQTAAGILSSSNLSQTVGLVSLQVADKLRGDSHFREACDVYKYALGIFQDHPPDTRDDIDARKLVADLLRNIGIVKCNLGEMAAGCQLMEESATLFEWSSSDKKEILAADVCKIAEVWYELGNMFLSDEYRSRSLLDHVMELTQTEILGVPADDPDSDDEDDDDDDINEQKPTEDGRQGRAKVNESSYSVCINEAINCYQKALELLDGYRPTRSSDASALAELYAGTLSRLGDCFLSTDRLDQAVVAYERSLPHFRLAAVGTSPDRRRPLLDRNAHVLAQLGTINFLLRNYWRAAAIFETAMMLRHKLKLDADDAGVDGPLASPVVDVSNCLLESAWLFAMYALTCDVLARDHQCVLWNLRAFAAYVGVLRGRIIDLEPLRRWFVVRTLLALGRLYAVVDEEGGPVKAVHYLTVAKNLACAAPEDQRDFQQTIEVLDQLTDACSAVGDTDAAGRYQNEATELAKSFYGDTPLTVSAVDQGPSHRHQPSANGPDVNPDQGTVPELIEGVKSMISTMGLGVDDVDLTGSDADVSAIREAELHLQEAVSKAGCVASVGLNTANGVSGNRAASWRKEEQMPDRKSNGFTVPPVGRMARGGQGATSQSSTRTEKVQNGDSRQRPEEQRPPKEMPNGDGNKTEKGHVNKFEQTADSHSGGLVTNLHRSKARVS